MLLNNEKLKQSLAAYSHIFAVLALGASTKFIIYVLRVGNGGVCMFITFIA